MSLLDFLSGLSYFSLGSVIVPIAFYFLSDRNNKLANKLLILFFASLISDVVNEIYVGFGMRGYPIINLFFALQFALLCLIYFSLLKKKLIVFSIFLSFAISFVIYSAFVQSIQEYQTPMILFESCALLAFALRYSLEMIQVLPAKNILNYFPAWVNTTVFFYFGFNFFLLALAEYIFKNTSQEVSMVFWAFHNLNNIIKNGLFATGLYVCFVQPGKDEGSPR